MSEIVKVENLSHSYNGSTWAIKDINFVIENNGVFGLLGSNGAGKSTTMNIICNVLTQSKGEVYIGGYDLTKNPIKAKKFIGFLPQKPPLHTELTVEEYLYHAADIRMIAKKDIPSAIDKAMAKCGITHFRNRVIKNLSGGYQQRVGIAQSIIHNPPFVILDEPTNGLDPNQILEIRGLIREIAKDKAVLISTHILPEVQASCDYIMMIENGNVVFKGTIDEFNSYMAPSAIIAIMHNPPSDEIFLSIEGMERVERLTQTRIRLHFKEGVEVFDTIVAKASLEGWKLREISLEKESLDKVFAKLSGKS